MKRTGRKIGCLVMSGLLTLALAACGNTETPASSTSTANSLADDEFVDIGITPESTGEATQPGGTTPQGEPAQPGTPGSTNGTTKGGGGTTKGQGPAPTTSTTKPVNIQTDPSLQPKEIQLTDKTIRIIGIDQEQFHEDESTGKFLKEHYGAKIEQIVTNVGEWFTKLQSMQMAGDPADLVSGTSGGFPDILPQNVVQPVDEIIDIDHPVMQHLKGSYEKYGYKGKHYLVPWLETPTDFVFYNAKTIRDAGLEDPYALSLKGEWTWDTYKEYATELRVKSGNTTSVWGLSLIDHHQAYLVDSTGKATVVLDANGNFVSNLRDPDIKRAVNFLNDIVNVSKVAFVTDATSLLDDGKCVMQQAPYFFNESYPKLRKSKNFGMAPMPRDPQNQNYYQSGNTLGYFVSKGKNVNTAGIEAFIQSAVITEKLKTLPNSQEYKDNIAAQKEKYPQYTEEEIRAQSDQYQAMWDLPKFYSPINYVVPQKLYWEVVRDKKPYDTVVEALEPELNGKIKDLNAYVK